MIKKLVAFFVFAYNIVAGQQMQQIEKAGEKLKAFYLSMNVERHWIAGHHVAWQTGEPDMPESIHGNKTHCSAFAA